MKIRFIVTLLAASGWLLATSARATENSSAVTALDAGDAIGPTLEPVDHIPALSRIYSWKAVDNDTLIIWATPSHPYLVRLDQPSHDLRFVEAIGVSKFGGRINARFDKVYVAGLDYRISEIYRLSRDDAKTFF
jgi:Family of unknown function (DUF6491)